MERFFSDEASREQGPAVCQAHLRAVQGAVREFTTVRGLAFEVYAPMHSSRSFHEDSL